MKGNRQRLTENKKRMHKAFFKTLIAFIIIVSLLLYADSKIRPIVESMASYQVRLLVTQKINDSVVLTLNENETTSKELVTVDIGTDGTVASIQTDSAKINRLKAEITSAVSENLKTLSTQTIGIPLGSLTGVQFFSGRGPRLTFAVIPSSFVQSTFDSSFTTAGINQTVHRINIEIVTSVLAIIPGYSTRTEIVADFCIAETVIVGTVPDMFANIE